MVGLHHLALSSLLLAAPIAALYKEKGPVTMLTEDNFEQALSAVHKTAIVEFFAPWCGHCQKLAKDYEQAARDLRGFADVFAVDCEDDKAKELCRKQGIKGFPTLKLVRPNPKTDGKKKYLIKEYTGGRKIKDIVTGVLEGLPNNIKRLTVDDFEEWLETKNSTSKTILFSDKGVTPALYKALKIDFGDKVEMAMVRDKEFDVLKYFGIEKVPAFVYLPGGTEEGVRFAEKKMDRQHVYNWLKKWHTPLLDADLTAIERAKILNGEAKKDSKKEVKTEEKKESKAEEAEKPKDSPAVDESQMIWFIPTLTDLDAIQQACFTTKTKTCILGLTDTPAKLEDPTLAGFKATHDYYRVHHKGVVSFYKLGTSTEAGKWVREVLGLSESTSVVAVNGHRKWFRVYSGNQEGSAVENWVDEIRLGDAAKEKLPANAIVEPSQDEPMIPLEKMKDFAKEAAEDVVDKVKEVKEEVVGEKKEGHDEL